MGFSSAPAGRWTDLPEDIAVAVASRLQEADVCALGACSRSWRSACDADCVWERLFRCRWPAAAPEAAAAARVQAGRTKVIGPEWSLHTSSLHGCLYSLGDILEFGCLEGFNCPFQKGWKTIYINQHRRMAAAISNVVEFVERSLNNGSLESEYYLKAIADLALMTDIGFLDVQFFLFSRNHSAIINLIGLHHSIASLHVPPTEVRKALQARRVAERKVCLNLLKLGRWFYGFRLPDEHESRKISLGGLTMVEGAEILAILSRGAVHEVFRLRISLPSIDK